MLNRAPGPESTPPDGPQIVDMKSKVWQWVLNQSPAMIIMLFLSWLLWQKVDQLEAAERACRQEIIEIHVEQNNKLIQAIDRMNLHLETLKEK